MICGALPHSLSFFLTRDLSCPDFLLTSRIVRLAFSLAHPTHVQFASISHSLSPPHSHTRSLSLSLSLSICLSPSPSLSLFLSWFDDPYSPFLSFLSTLLGCYPGAPSFELGGPFPYS